MKKVSKNIYEIPKENNMKVPARIFASEEILENIKKDKTIEQIECCMFAWNFKNSNCLA